MSMMEKTDACDGSIDISDYEIVLSTSSVKGSENAGDNDPDFLEDIDLYWEDLSARLTVSRMVSDAVIRGMVNAVAQEAAEQINSKEEQLASLREKIHSIEVDASKYDHDGLSSRHAELNHGVEAGLYLHSFSELNHVESINKLKVAAEEQLQRLNHESECIKSYICSRQPSLGSRDTDLCLQQDKISESFVRMGDSVDFLMKLMRAVYRQIAEYVCLPKDSFCEQEWKWDFQKKLDTIIFQNYVRGLQEEIDSKLCQEQKIDNIRNKSWSRTYDDLSALRKELEIINKSLFFLEPGHLILQCNPDCIDDWSACNTTTKDNISRKTFGNHVLPHSSHPQENGEIVIGNSEISMPEFGESPLLMHMSKEELIGHFKTEMTKMKRHHESALQEKTEELFKVKRELLKEKGSSPLRKDREFEVLRKIIPEFILKLDDILADNEPVARDDRNELSCLRDKINELLFENQRLRDLLADKRKEIKFLSAQVSDAANQMSSHSSAEAKFLKQLKKLRQDMEDVRTEVNLRDVIHDIFLKEWIGEIKRQQEDMSEAEVTIIHEMYRNILQGFIEDVKSSVDTVTVKHNAEKRYLEKHLFQKDEVLCLEVERTKKLEYNVESLSKLIAEKEKFAQEAEFSLSLQKERFDFIYQELNLLKQHVEKQENFISQTRKESESLKGKLNSALDQVHHCENENSRLGEKISAALDDLKEAHSQKNVLQEIIKEKEGTILLSLAEKRVHREEMKSIAICILKLAKSFEDFENKMKENVQKNIARLGKVQQVGSFKHYVDGLRREILWYRQNLEIKSSNLQKAEMEVDLLGDEVDALLSILAKMYIALDHYSPVLQHYPGVMEILKLVRSELEGNAKQT